MDLLTRIRKHAELDQAPPSLEVIEQEANFREPGGLGRCLQALQQVCRERIDNSPEKLALRLAKTIILAHNPEPGELPATAVATEAELYATILRALR